MPLLGVEGTLAPIFARLCRRYPDVPTRVVLTRELDPLRRSTWKTTDERSTLGFHPVRCSRGSLGAPTTGSRPWISGRGAA
jgi:hypothetical protein